MTFSWILYNVTMIRLYGCIVGLQKIGQQKNVILLKQKNAQWDIIRYNTN